MVPAVAAAGRRHGRRRSRTSRRASTKLSARLPKLLDAGERARVDAAVATYAGQGVPERPGRSAWSRSTRCYATLDIAEVAGNAKRPVEPVAAIYFDLANRLGVPWLREKIAALPGDQHWQMLAKSRHAG